MLSTFYAQALLLQHGIPNELQERTLVVADTCREAVARSAMDLVWTKAAPVLAHTAGLSFPAPLKPESLHSG